MSSRDKNPESISSVRPQVSLIIPAYNEDGNLLTLYSRLAEILSSLDAMWEVIFVDDGSTDNTWNQILSLHEDNKSVKGIRLSRNFGHQYALLAGLSHSVGDAVISMDADLQHPPDLIPQLISEWEKGNMIVNTIRIDSDDLSLFKKIASRVFYKLFGLLSGVRIESGMADFRLLDRKIVDNILQFREESFFLRGLIQWVGYKNSTIKYKSLNRQSGSSKYTLKKMFRFALDGITSFSIIPLRVGIFLGLITAAISFMAIFYAIYAKLFTNSAVPGWASTLAILSFLQGILFILLGLIGDYIGRILLEVKKRPRFLIATKLGIDSVTTNIIDRSD